MNAECKVQNAERLPLTREVAFSQENDGGREKINVFTTPQSTSLTAPLTRGAEF